MNFGVTGVESDVGGLRRVAVTDVFLGVVKVVAVFFVAD